MAFFNITFGNDTFSDGNSTIVESDTAASLSSRNSTLSFLIGFGIVLAASVLNALGLNITKLDHQRNSKIPRSQRSPDFLRPLWIVGLLSYIVSQLVGSTLALEYLRSEFVAPLGSSSLIFNFLFAKLIVKTAITKLDVVGTLVIIVGVVGIVAFGNVRAAGTIDIESTLNLEVLKGLWTRLTWILYFVFLELTTILIYTVASVYDQVWVEREQLENPDEARPEVERYGAHDPRKEKPKGFVAAVRSHVSQFRALLRRVLSRWLESKPDVTVKRVGGFLWAVCAGLLSSQTLIFAKSAVKLFSTGASQLAHPLSIIIVVLLAITAVAQIVCLNKGLRLSDSTLVVPVLFACYTGFGFINSLVYLDQTQTYSRTIGGFIILSVLVLVVGVGILSSKKPEVVNTPRTFEEEEAATADAAKSGGIAMSVFSAAKDRVKHSVERVTGQAGGQQQDRSRPTGTQLLSRSVDFDEDDDSKTVTGDDSTNTTVWDSESPFDDKHERKPPRDSLDGSEGFGDFAKAEHR